MGISRHTPLLALAWAALLATDVAAQQAAGTATTQNYFQRIANDIGGFFVGVLLLCIAPCFLAKNEWRHVQKLKQLGLCEDKTVVVNDSTDPDESNCAFPPRRCFGLSDPAGRYLQPTPSFTRVRLTLPTHQPSYPPTHPIPPVATARASCTSRARPPLAAPPSRTA